MFNLSESDLSYILKIIRKYPEIHEVLIFGSRAKGNDKKTSDIDLALKGDALETVALKVSGELNDEGPLPYKVDVIYYEAISNDNLKDHIDRVGIKIYPIKA